ncbi:NADP-dependent oxidoreductase [Corallococcus exiguus]|uniref:Zinc-binding dehydrogenase n=1 Tax=Corallococcus exiguus TaxID=83462 RepID=A0A7Y1S1U7_9BACT|nr:MULTISPECIES: NADP-dependent oxidoreductase [Corallococcus]NBC39131.1 zinc-binding dehydrogenase [Corallococcus exiguus]NNC16622.1 NADP-dependent oxidoreductase [Corallococcus exiguus]NRD54651.1 NADP-dependent oxidoreductase [Corallococcus exiguus]NRD60974.1 NADP-dependent oxidoreductase [Corallococcus exiguus]RKH24759.1 NADP-dependent oxidoreductase [Corallococcus sp. CA041A]
MATPLQGREIRLKSRPHGEPTPDNFEFATVTVPEPAEGQVLVRNHFMSVDPYMRGRMNDAKSYVPPFKLGEVMDGGSVGQVIRSRSPDFKEGDFVVAGTGGWREYAVAPAKHYQKADPSVGPLSAYLGVLGMPGMTAYVGLLDIGKPKAGDTVFVSAAAGAVGGVVGQIARIKGCRVVGSVGSDAKVKHLRDDLKFDAAINYKSAPIAESLAKACPDGIDVYFDNVGGDHLEAAIGLMKNHGRIVLCGAISVYNATAPTPGPRNLGLAVGKRLTLQGYIVMDHADRRADFLRDVGQWLREGKVQDVSTIVDGLDKAPDAFIGLLRGDNTGKMLVRLAKDA